VLIVSMDGHSHLYPTPEALSSLLLRVIEKNCGEGRGDRVSPEDA